MFPHIGAQHEREEEEGERAESKFRSPGSKVSPPPTTPWGVIHKKKKLVEKLVEKFVEMEIWFWDMSQLLQNFHFPSVINLNKFFNKFFNQVFFLVNHAPVQ